MGSNGLTLAQRCGKRIYLIHGETGDVITVTVGRGEPDKARLTFKASDCWTILREELLADPDKPGIGPEFANNQ